MVTIAIIAKLPQLSPYSATYDQAFKFRGEVHEKEFSCGSSNAVTILLSKSDIFSMDLVQTRINFPDHLPFNSSIHTQSAHGERSEEI